MSWPEPLSVRIIRPDGSIVGCDVLLEPEPDEDGMDVFTVWPAEGYQIQAGDQLEASYLPGRSVLVVPLAPGAEGDGT